MKFFIAKLTVIFILKVTVKLIKAFKKKKKRGGLRYSVIVSTLTVPSSDSI